MLATDRRSRNSLCPPLPHSREIRYGAWIGDQDRLNPETARAFDFDLEKLLLVYPPDAGEVWRVGLEAVQSGLFHWIVLRPSRASPIPQLRKLSLAAVRARARVLVICAEALPHWVFVRHETSALSSAATGSSK